MNCIYRKIC